LLTGTRVFLFGYRPRSIVGSGYSRSISAGGSWRPYLLVFRVWLIRSLTPPKTELPATIANRRPKVEKYRGKFIRREKVVEVYFVLKRIFNNRQQINNHFRSQTEFIFLRLVPCSLIRHKLKKITFG
jgi:hypothetical protein